jgi:hypothetical protein
MFDTEHSGPKLIFYARVKVDILDRKGLEGAACECYQTIRAEDARLNSLSKADVSSLSKTTASS